MDTNNEHAGVIGDRGALITMPGAMAELNVGRNTLYKFINSGQLKTVTLGRRRYTTRRFVDEFVASLEAGAA